MGEHLLTLARELARDWRVCVAAPASGGGGELLERARAAGLGVAPLQGRSEATRCESLRSWLGTSEVDVFHVHAGISWEGCAGTLTAAQARVPVLVRTEHQTYRPCTTAQRAAHRQIVPIVDRFVCVSKAVAASFAEQGVPAGRLAVVPNGVPDPGHCSHSREEVLAGLGLPARARMLLSVGRLHVQKGHRHLLAAVPAVLRGQPDVHFVSAGTGPQERQLREAVKREGLGGRVHLLGRRADVPDLLAAAYALVLPSLFEGLPLVALEAMAAGRPVIGTAVPGTSEAVLDGMTGRLVPPADPAALAAALLELLASPQTAARWGAAGRRRYQTCFTSTRMSQQTAAIYRKLLTRSGARPRPCCKGG
ncbi:MAG: glycosyltransferase family 4 protein [Chloroflexota bacterium]|nr:glycosyltransferase family 4 protein [Chloroflexota bacterium]